MGSEEQKWEGMRQDKLARMQAFLDGIDSQPTVEGRLNLGKTLGIEFGVVEEPDPNLPETGITE